jgi:hypothetical protein
MSDKRRLADSLLEGNLQNLISDSRRRGMSWELIAREIWIRTDRVINVTGQTVNTGAAQFSEAS